MNNIFLQKITNFLFLKTHFSQNLCNLTIKPSYRFSSRTFLLHDLSIQIIIRTISFFIYLPAFFSIHCLSLLCSFSLLMIISNMAIEFHLIRLITNLHYLIKHTTSMSITFKSPTNEKKPHKCGIYAVIAYASAVVLLAKGTLNASSILHREILACIIAAPQEFFDTTPIGRILSRFSTDINTVDSSLPMCLRQILNVFFRVGVRTM